MGLFGSSPQKKLERAREMFASGRWFEAMRHFEEVAGAGSKVTEGERSESLQGIRRCRERMIAMRLEESEALRLAGDLEGARDRCQTALDLAGDDLDAAPVQEQLRRIDAPSRPVAAGPDVGEVRETDLLPDAEQRVILKPTPLDRPPRPTAPREDADLFGEDPETLFEIHLHALTPPVADYFRGLGPDFRFGYLALVQGEGRRALDFFDRVDWGVVRHPAALRALANALLLADRAEEALAQLDAMTPPGAPGAAGRTAAPPAGAAPAGALPESASGLPADEPDGEARRRYLRIDALRLLGRFEDACDDARILADAVAGIEPSPTLEGLLGWVLIEAGRPQEAFDRLSRRLREIGYQEEILIPTAQAAVALKRDEEAIRLLEEFIHLRMERGLVHHQEVDFPVEAGRRLLEIHRRRGADETTLRTLIMHLIDHDPQEGETYRDLLVQLDARVKERGEG